MEVWESAGLAFAALFGLMMLGLPIAFAMLAVGGAGLWLSVGERAAFGIIGQIPFTATMSYELSVVPMFLLMGAFVTRAGMSEDLYRLCHGFLGHRRGGLAMATVAACGGFAAVSGSSIATAATMAKVAMPEMRRYRYSDGLAASSIAAGGTLGILIPPSVIMVLYGIATGTDIGQLFIAGIAPGVVAILFYLLAVAFVVRRNPAAGPAADPVPLRERFARLLTIGPVLALFVLIIGGIYAGIFTPTEAAGVGAAGALLFALLRRSLTPRLFLSCLLETVRTTASLFVVLIGALVFSNFMNLIGLPRALEELVTGAGLSPLAVILVIFGIYLVLGCFMESLSMILLTVPVLFPVVSALGFDPVWFGIFVVMATELSLITPPLGLNLFVIQGVIRDVKLGTIYRGIVPFVVADIARVLLIIALPGLVLFLPKLMAG
ncbi:TRAP transporter large permease [Roseomonas sp. AR75]|uniref:TRAP transporter large permease n=1 Tax=Roseomonas sp. AR75 TaxID=2562311 RepID=UPI0010C0F622|nr:TRAP transporter large permease [Roseomonas sp. AR75]